MTASKRKYDYLELFSIREKERLNSLNLLKIDQFQKELESFHPISQINQTKKKSQEKKEKSNTYNAKGRGIPTEIENTKEKLRSNKEGLEWKEEEIKKREENDLEEIRKKEEKSFKEFMMRGKKWEQLMLEKQMRRKLKYGDNSPFSPEKTSYKESKSQLPKSRPVTNKNEKFIVSLEDMPVIQHNELKQDGQKEDVDGRNEINSVSKTMMQLKMGGKKEGEQFRKAEKQKKFESLGLSNNMYKKCLEEIMKMN